jgi:hypothetical protein
MTIPPIAGGGSSMQGLRPPVLTAPVTTGAVPRLGDAVAGHTAPAAQTPDATATRSDAPIALAGRLEHGGELPDTTELALALESATRLLQHGRADDVLRALDVVWSDQLAADSPWYLRTAALQLLGRTSDAEQVLRTAIARLPRSAAMLYLLSVHTAARGHVDAARLANAHAQSLHPTEPLLQLQGAALDIHAVTAGALTALLERMRADHAGLPADIWLATLIRLHDQASGSARVPSSERASRTPTPRALPAVVTGHAAPQSPAMPDEVLTATLRYGLSLLDSPTQSARVATQLDAAMPRPSAHVGVSAELAAVAAAAVAPVAPERAALPRWESLLLIAAAGVIVLAPPLRIPALLAAGVAALGMVARGLR